MLNEARGLPAPRIPVTRQPCRRLEESLEHMRSSPLTDEAELIARAVAGDSVALRALYDAHRVSVYSTIRRLVDDPALADDVSQETWIRAFRRLSSFRGDSAFSLWVHRIAVNSALYARRAFLRRERVQEPLLDAHAVPSVQLERVEQRFLSERIDAAVRQLPARMRAVIVLHDIEGHTHQEIAHILSISPGTSKSQLSKARVQLRRLLVTIHAEHSDAASQ